MVALGAYDKCLAKLNGNTWSVSIASKSWSGSLTQHHQRDLLPKGMDCMNSRQRKAQEKREGKRIRAFLLPMFKSMKQELEKADFDKQQMISDLAGCIADLEAMP